VPFVPTNMPQLSSESAAAWPRREGSIQVKGRAEAKRFRVREADREEPEKTTLVGAGQESFDLQSCVTELVRVSDGWSYRVLEQVLREVQVACLGTERYTSMCAGVLSLDLTGTQFL